MFQNTKEQLRGSIKVEYHSVSKEVFYITLEPRQRLNTSCFAASGASNFPSTI